MSELLFTAAALVIVPALLLGVVRFFRNAPDLGTFSARGLEVTWYAAATVAAFLMLLVVVANSTHGPMREINVMGLLALVVLGVFVNAWRREVLFLMSLRDHDFPGRFDKPIWATLLIGLAPVGFWLFRSYRLAHWAEAKPETIRGDAAADLS